MSNQLYSLDVTFKKFNEINSQAQNQLSDFENWLNTSKSNYKEVIADCNAKINTLSSKEGLLNKTQEKVDRLNGIADEMAKQILSLDELKSKYTNSYNSVQSEIAKTLENFNKNSDANFAKFQAEGSKQIELFKQNVEARIYKTLSDEKATFEKSCQTFYDTYQMKLSDLDLAIKSAQKKSASMNMISISVAAVAIIASIVFKFVI